MSVALACPIPRAGDLELIVEPARGVRSPVSLLFVHGINVGAWIWQRHYMPHFAAAGFDCYAVSLRGHGASAGRDRIRDWRMGDYVLDVAEVLERIAGPVVLVGHSLGGAVVQRYVRDHGRVAGMALLASVPPWGLAHSAWRMSVTDPRLWSSMLALTLGKTPAHNDPAFRRALFSPDTHSTTIEEVAKRAGPESPWAVIDAQGWPPFAPAPWAAPPAFVLGGSIDRLIPEDEVRRTGMYYGAVTRIVPDLAHALMLEPRWEPGAHELEAWLKQTFN